MRKVIFLVNYTIEIDQTLCIACGACYGSDLTHFAADPSGKSTVIGGKTQKDLSTGTFNDGEIIKAKDAQDACPASAIAVIE